LRYAGEVKPSEIPIRRGNRDGQAEWPSATIEGGPDDSEHLGIVLCIFVLPATIRRSWVFPVEINAIEYVFGAFV